MTNKEKNGPNEEPTNEKPGKRDERSASKKGLTQVKNAHATGSGTLERDDLEQTGSVRKPITGEGMEGAEQY